MSYTNSEDPDQTPRVAAFDQGLTVCLRPMYRAQGIKD